MLTQEQIKKILHYDPNTGVFIWRAKPCKNMRVGSVAGTKRSNGYAQIRIEGKDHKAHRLAWLYMHGEFPPNDIDHINRVKTDNRICNLRPATRAENLQNKSMHSNNTSGHTGVCWFKKTQKWQAKITINKKKIHLGYFTDISEAIASRKAAEQKFHTFQNAVGIE